MTLSEHKTYMYIYEIEKEEVEIFINIDINTTFLKYLGSMRDGSEIWVLDLKKGFLV